MEQIRKRVPEKLVYAGILLYTLERCWNASAILPYSANVDKILKISVALMMVLAIFRQSFTPKMYLIYGLAAVGAAAIRLRTGLMLDVFTLLMILACREADLTRVVNIIRRTTTVFLLAHTLYFFCLLLLGKQELFYVEWGGRVRARFGLLGPNLVSSYFFNLVLMWAWEKYDMVRLKQLVWILVLATVLFRFTDSRTAYFCTVALCLLLILLKHSRFAEKCVNFIAAWCAPALGLLVLVGSYNWRKGFFSILNRLLSDRIKLSAYGISNFGFTLYGQRVDYSTIIDPQKWDIFYMPTFTFDCVYSYLWSNIGIIWLVVICLCFFILARRKNPRFSLCLIFWALYGMCEVTVMSIVRFFPLLLISSLFLSKEEFARLYSPQSAMGTADNPIERGVVQDAAN